MPKFGTHILIAELAAKRRPALFGGAASNAMRLGAVGPDLMLFLFDPAAKTPGVMKAFDTAMEALRIIQEIEDKLKSIAKLFDTDLANWVTGGMSGDLSRLAESGVDAITLALKLSGAVGAGSINVKNPIPGLVSNQLLDPKVLSDPKYLRPDLLVGVQDRFGFPFRHFGHPYTDDPGWHTPAPVGNYDEWWWMDMLHYRKTVSFSKSLEKVAKASASRPMRDYAFGYLSHVAGDICGHPFINGLVQGPFRSHAYRHIVLEGLADTWLWNHQGRGDIAEASLHALVALGDADRHAVMTQIHQAIKLTYPLPGVPKQLPNRYPEVSELKGAYERMFKYLDLSTGGTVSRPKKPAENPGEVWREIQERLTKANPGQPPAWQQGDPLAAILAALGWAFRGIVFLLMLATLPMHLLVSLAALPGRWAIYLAHLGIYLLVSGLRTLLALLGWGYASRDDFMNFGSLLDPLITVGINGRDDSYPFASTPVPKPPLYWLMPPRAISKSEKNYAVLGPFAKGVKPDWIVSPSNRMGTMSEVLPLLSASTPAQTRVAAGTMGNGFGNAVDFFIALAEGRIPTANLELDLDGDRGYGYKPWDTLPPNEKYL